jgi:hypothetical protein
MWNWRAVANPLPEGKPASSRQELVPGRVLDPSDHLSSTPAAGAGRISSSLRLSSCQANYELFLYIFGERNKDPDRG